MKYFLFTFLFTLNVYSSSLNIDILYLEEIIQKPPVLSNIIDEPKDSGLSGAKLAIIDSNKTARFMKQKYILQSKVSKKHEELINKFETFVKKGKVYIILNVQELLFKKLITHPMAKKVLFINAGNTSSALRINICQKNVLHTIASDAMLYDALTQFLIKRRWKDWLVLSGKKTKDLEILAAIKRSAKRFGANIIEEKTWTSSSDIRRKAQNEMPVFTQGKNYDVVLSADFYGDFGEYVYFNTWLPRPLAGTQGLRPVTWHKVIEAWGAAQLQKRFEKTTKRWMNSKDYASWLAVRSIVTSVLKTKEKDVQKNINNIYSETFDLGAYKGRKLSFRNFNGQLRQPISLVHPRALVSTSPQEGFLHPKTDLDTLGIAKYEMKCSL